MAVARCTPNTAQWADATSAFVESVDTPFSSRNLPVEHRDPGIHHVERTEYPDGVVLIPTGNDPSTIPAILPAIVTAGDEEDQELDPSNPMDAPKGGGVVFV